jgi:hypothetical protein
MILVQFATALTQSARVFTRGSCREPRAGGLAGISRRPSQARRISLGASRPEVRVGREGLNLHESCRIVVQFHAEWNPAVIEQQIGRVDRKGSRCEQLAQAWLEG